MESPNARPQPEFIDDAEKRCLDNINSIETGLRTITDADMRVRRRKDLDAQRDHLELIQQMSIKNVVVWPVTWRSPDDQAARAQCESVVAVLKIDSDTAGTIQKDDEPGRMVIESIVSKIELVFQWALSSVSDGLVREVDDDVSDDEARRE